MNAYNITYDPNTDTYLVVLESTDSSNDGILKDIFSNETTGLIDGDILHSGWCVDCWRYRVYSYPDDWKHQLDTNSFFVISFVGHLEHVIPRKERTMEQHYFIERIFGDD